MRYPAAEKLEIIRLVEQSPLPVRHTLTKLGIPRPTFYRWYVGQRNFWRPAKSAWPATRHEPQPRMRSRSCAGRPAH